MLTFYRKIPEISPEAYIFQRPFLRGLFIEGLIYGGKFAFQNWLGLYLEGNLFPSLNTFGPFIYTPPTQ